MIPKINPTNAAIDLRKSLGWIHPSDFTLEIVADSLGISIKELPIKGSQGRIIMNGDNGIISINSNIDYQPSKNFIIAHEIGHFVLHKNLLVCSDTDKTLSEWHKKGPQETEANDFASELLMPSSQYIDKVKGEKMSLELIENVSSYFGVSKLSAFLKYISHGDYPAMVIFMENGLVKWKKHSSDFPFTYLAYNSEIPPYTVAGDFFYQNSSETEPEEVDAIEWFPEDFQIQFKKNCKLWEQCYLVSENGLVSCLWSF